MNLERFLSPYAPPTTNLVDCLRYWTDHQPGEIAYFTDGEGQDRSLSYAELDNQLISSIMMAARVTTAR